MPTKNVNLSEQQAKFIRQSIKHGRYRNASEIVRAGLRLLQQQEAEDQMKLDALRQVAKDAFGAIDRGQHITVAADGIDAFLDKLDAKPLRRKSA